jgi:surfeit locus 1 family protein
MLQQLRTARLLAPTLLALPALAVLVALGTWQMQRRAWKEALIEQIGTRTKAEPVALDAFLAAPRSHPEAIEYTRVRVRGRFLHDREIHLHAIEKGTAGWHVVTPLFTPRSTAVFVNRGFVPDALKDRQRRVGGLIEGEAEFNGLVRAFPSAKGAFVPENDVGRNQWYWLDHPAMLRYALESTERSYAPFLVEAERVTVAVPPAGGATRLDPPNRHLEYALTWYGLALTLAGVYGAFARGRLKRPAKPGADT